MASQLTTAAGIIGWTGPVDQMPWQTLTYGHLVRVRAVLLQRGRAPASVNAALAALRGVARASLAMGLIDADQLAKVLAVPKANGGTLIRRRSLSAKEVAALMATCRRGTAALRDHAILALMVYAGLRRSEVVALDLGDWIRPKEILVRRGKGNRLRTASLIKPAKLAVSRWVKVRAQWDGALFCPISSGGAVVHRRLSTQAVYDLVQGRGRQAGLGPLRPHDLRRTFVTQLLVAGADLNTVRHLAGHQALQTTAAYDCRDQAQWVKALRALEAILAR